MIAHFTMTYENDIGISLTELWQNHCLKEQQKSVNIFDRKRDWYLNNNTAEFHINSEEKKSKQESKQNNSNNRRTQTKEDLKIVKIETEAEFLLKKEQIIKGLQNKIREMIRTKNTLHHQNQEINTVTRKRSINLGNSIVLQSNKKTKQLLMWL